MSRQKKQISFRLDPYVIRKLEQLVKYGHFASKTEWLRKAVLAARIKR